MKLMVNVKNAPNEINKQFIVVRFCAGEFWYIGQYDDAERADDVALSLGMSTVFDKSSYSTVVPGNTINKQTVLDVIHKTIYQFFDVCGDNEEMPLTDKDKLLLSVNKAICNNIKALEHKSNWIPVSSKNLPKMHKKVLISTTDGKVNKAYRRHKEWTENQYEWIVHEMLGYSYTYTDDEVLAWQPLPESYKPDNEKPSDNTDKDTLPPIIW